jgi:hypothetical protein
MKKITVLLMLSISITVSAVAQTEIRTTKPGKLFDLDPEYFKRRFLINLGKGNQLQVEVADPKDLEQLANIDSILHIFLHDIAIFEDSLSDELSSKNINYIIDETGKNKLRIQSTQPNSSSFLVQQGAVAALKLAQDTVYITGTVSNTATKKTEPDRCYRLGFFVNQVTDINNIVDGGLHEKMITLSKSNHERWIKDGGRWQIKNGDNTIYSDQPAGYVSAVNDYLAIFAGAGIQNYKNYFAPSFTVSAKAVFMRSVNKYDVSISWEPHFMFAKNSTGNPQTFRNDFITLSGGFEPKTSQKNYHYTAHFDILQHFSLGYLIHRKGDFFDAHSFRLGTGAINWMEGKIKLEPILYFHDFFKGTTPGLRFLLNF